MDIFLAYSIHYLLGPNKRLENRGNGQLSGRKLLQNYLTVSIKVISRKYYFFQAAVNVFLAAGYSVEIGWIINKDENECNSDDWLPLEAL